MHCMSVDTKKSYLQESLNCNFHHRELSFGGRSKYFSGIIGCVKFLALERYMVENKYFPLAELDFFQGLEKKYHSHFSSLFFDWIKLLVHLLFVALLPLLKRMGYQDCVATGPNLRESELDG